MTTPTSVQVEGAGPELPATLVALGRARAAAAAWSFALLEWLPLSRALDAIRAVLWEREREYPAAIRTTQRGARRLAEEALALIEAAHLAPEVRSALVPLIRDAHAALDRLAAHAPVVRPAERAEQC
jgi:hypothetical protein